MKYFSAYFPIFPKAIIYMLQSNEYRVGPYLSWLWRVEDFRRLMHRRQLVMTKAARIMLWLLLAGIGCEVGVGVGFIACGIIFGSLIFALIGCLLLICYPFIWSHLIVLPLLLGRLVYERPRQNHAIEAARRLFTARSGMLIGVAGSYGKTSMKELLAAVLSQGKKVAVTPGNKNVPLSHLAFAKHLHGDEDVIIVEYGEEKPGDIKTFLDYTHPDIGIVTGLAPNHLDKYKTLDNVAEDLLLVSKRLGRQAYLNGDSHYLREYAGKKSHFYDQTGALGWTINHVQTSITGLTFRMQKSDRQLLIKSQLLGRHNIGPIVLVAALADELGLSRKQIEDGVANFVPYEHRMQPIAVGGAWLIDDTYNGNIEGMLAGLALLGELKTTGRKVYVTPGLVEQGRETEAVHKILGEAIAKAKPDVVVLMQNSAAPVIERAMKEHDYKGSLLLQDDPLAFYNSLEHFVAAGDIVLMQNDWTDNYS